MDIILASQSPRREELLRQVVPEFRVVPSGFDEGTLREEDPLRFAIAAAEAKAREVGSRFPEALVIAADTVVNLGREILGKPRDEAEAREMLGRLSGSRHRVITAVTLFKKDEDKLATGYAISRVTFRKLAADLIEAYLATGDYRDKAGSYAVQEIGDAFVGRLDGDYDNVVGLPLKCLRRLLDEFRPPVLRVTISDIALPHDWGVGRLDNAVVFVPGAVLGDAVSLTIAKKERRHLFGRLVRVEEGSPDRVAPVCPHFGVCGGCSFQNLAYARQLEVKESYLVRTMERLGRVPLDGVERTPIVPSPAPYGYRNKMEYAFSGPAGKVRAGLRERATPLDKYKKGTAVLDVCPIFSPAVERLFPVFAGFASAAGRPAFDPLARTGYFRNLVLRESKSTGDILAVVVTRSGGGPDLDALAAELRSGDPGPKARGQVRSLWTVESDRVSDVVDYAGKRHVFGERAIEERLGELRLKIHPESFFQPNPAGAAILYAGIVDEARRLGARRALGLYCGSGSIELSLAGAVAEVVGVDSEPANILAADENARLNGISNCRFIRGRVEDALRENALGGFDLLVIDPPRSGISGKGLKLILGLNIPHLIYVSCNPGAFSRDVRLLLDHGYGLKRLGCYDFFPQTPHLECLGILSR